jgi:hypothetical protein
MQVGQDRSVNLALRHLKEETGIETPACLTALFSIGIKQRKKMLHLETSALGHEWAVLQNNHEQYEKNCLLIKLGSIVLFVSSLALTLNVATAVSLMLIMWVQEGIFRTYQGRIGERILHVEQLLRQSPLQVSLSYQLHTEWKATRPGVSGLLAEYGKSMLRPTVAFPHVVLMLIYIGWSVLR